MPWVMLGVVAGLLVTRASDPMFLTALLAAGVAGLLFGILLGNVPEILDQLWKRGVFQVRKEDNCPTTERSPTHTGFTGRVALYLGSRLWQRFATQAKDAVQDQELGPAYLAFIDRVEQYLNSRLSWLCGLFIAGLMFLSFPARFSSGPDWWRHPLRWLFEAVAFGAWGYLASVVLQLIVAYVLGLLLWRIGVVAVMVSRLGARFDFDLRLQHPDHSGGLRPLGDLCLTNALILSVPAIYLAAWLIVIPGFGADHNRYAVYVPYYEVLLAVIFGLALITFALPLYAVHRAMLRQRDRLQGPLYELGARIDALTRSMLAEARTAAPDRLEKLRQEQEMLLKVYEATSDIPTWPFDRAILRRFSIAQFVPLLSLTGIAPSVVAALEKVFHQ